MSLLKSFFLLNQAAPEPPSPLLSGLTHRWSLDDLSLTDSVGADALTNFRSATAESGKLGNCNKLGTEGDAQLRGSASADYSLNAARTIALWFNLPTTTGLIIGKGLFAGNDEWYVYASAGTLRLTVKDATDTSQVTATSAFSINTWYPLVVQSNGVDRARYRFNGGAWQSVAMPSYKATHGLSLFGGADPSTLRDELAVWDRELSDAECAAWENGGAGLQYPFS